MKELPESETYEEGLAYWPYKASLEQVIEHIVSKAPHGARVLDMMCGPGYLLGELKHLRPDLDLNGVDIDERYVAYGSEKYPGVTFSQGDVRHWYSRPINDVIVCTGALHHVRYEQQGVSIANLALMLKPDGFAVISDCYVDDYSDETERLLAAAKLGYEYLAATIKNDAPAKVIEWTIDILHNDVLMHEFKPSLSKRLPQLKKHFATVTTTKAWPSIESGYGDYIHICSKL